MAASEILLTKGSTPATPAAGKVKVFANSSGNIATVKEDGSVVAAGSNATSQSTPADPTGTTDTTGKMMGLAGAITPASTGRVLIIISGNLTNSTATAGDGAKAQITYGTGTAPVNGAALTGTAVGNIVSSVLERATAGDLQAFTCQAVVSGLTIGTALWLDIRLAAIVGGTGQAKNISISAIEI
jgi:hypothetical protein